ncbi:MAG: RNA methyltransferase [Promethearchaeota archaeon]
MNKKLQRKELSSFKKTQLAPEYKNLEFSIVLNRPEHAANIGAIARLMKNFNFEHLIIYNPDEKAEKIRSYHTQGFAMHGKEILFAAEIITIENQLDHLAGFKELMKRFDIKIASTAKGMHYTNIRRLATFPAELTLPVSEKPLKIALVFGRESHGLTNDEIEMTDLVIRIPSSEDYPTLNLSQACGIILYEIYKKTHNLEIGRGPKPVLLANKKDKQMLYELIKNLIIEIRIRTYRKENVFFAFKNVFERAFVSKKEVNLIVGVFSKMNSYLKRRNECED